RTNKIVPFEKYDGYWGVFGPFEEGGILRGIWSYVLPYLGEAWGQVDDMWQVKLGRYNNKKYDTLEIKEVEVAVQNGAFNQIIVRTQKENKLIDFYSDVPISIATWNSVYNFNHEPQFEPLLFAKDDTGAYLILRANDLLYYTIHPQSMSNFIPMDTIITLKPGKETSRITLMRQNFIENFDLRIYSDISGLKRESSDGLLQLDLRYKFILNNSETETFYEAYQTFIYPALLAMLFYDVNKYVTYSLLAGSIIYFPQTPTSFATKIEPFVIIPRLEDRANLLITANDTVSASVNRFDLYRYADLKFGLDFEYMRARFDKLNLFASVGMSAGIIRTLLDSMVLHSNKIAEKQYLHSYFIMPYIQVEPISVENIKFVTRYSLLASKLLDKKINNIEITDGLSGSFIHIFQSDFNIYPDKRDKSSWLFFRAIYYASDPYSDLSLQFGYSTSLNNILNLGKEK
ncbi:MAG: hypothetical protein ABR936_13015, partial [Bacteroidota bacterium]